MHYSDRNTDTSYFNGFSGNAEMYLIALMSLLQISIVLIRCACTSISEMKEHENLLW